MKRNVEYITLSQLFLKRNNIGYFTNLIKKHVPAVPIVPTAPEPLLYQGSNGTNEHECKKEVDVTDVLAGTLGTSYPNIEISTNVPGKCTNGKGLQVARTKEQQEHGLNAKFFERIADYHYLYQERAAIYEYDGGVPKEEAERLAYLEMMYGYIHTFYPELKLKVDKLIAMEYC